MIDLHQKPYDKIDDGSEINEEENLHLEKVNDRQRQADKQLDRQHDRQTDWLTDL